MQDNQSTSQEILNNHILSEVLYDSVLDELKIPAEDKDYRALVLGVLKRQSTDHIVFSIWKNLSAEQNLKLRQLFNQSSITAPGVSHEDIMMEFAAMYPDLLKKVHESLAKFFEGFIAKFNEISEA